MKTLVNLIVLGLIASIGVGGAAAQAQALPGIVVNIDAHVYGDPVSGLPALDVAVPPGTYLLTEVDPATDSRAIYTAWSPIQSQAAWLSTLEVFTGHPGALTQLQRLGGPAGGTTPQQAFSDPLNLPIIVTSTSGFLTFGVDDNILWDNTGGISVRIEAVPPLLSLSLVPDQVEGGVSTTGTVTLGGPAPAAGATVSLSCSLGAVHVPSTVTVAGGATTATFSITTTPVTAKAIGQITATYAGKSKSTKFTVTPIGLKSLAISPGSVVGSTNASGTVTLDHPAAPGDITVQLISDTPGAALPPTTVVIPAGALSGTFTIPTFAVTVSTPVTISATDNYNTTRRTFTVLPIAIKSLSIAPASIVGSQTATGTVTLQYPAAPGNITVFLASDTSSAIPPITFDILAGSQTGTFAINTSAVPAVTQATISATAGGITVHKAFTLRPIGAKTVTLTPTTVFGMTFVIGVVTLDFPAPPGGTAVSLNSSDPTIAYLPTTSVTVPQGFTQAAFSIYTAQVLATTQVTISAKANGIAASRILTVNP